MPIKLSIQQSQLIRGVAILLLMVHHYSGMGYAWQGLEVFKGIGPAICCAFFFCSGYGLTAGNKKHGVRASAMRLVKVILPFIIANAIYMIYWANFRKYNPTPWHALTDLLGLTLINKHCWFLQALIVLYVAYFASINRGLKMVLPATVIAGSLYSLASGNPASVSWIGFPLGILAAGTSRPLRRAPRNGKPVEWSLCKEAADCSQLKRAPRNGEPVECSLCKEAANCRPLRRAVLPAGAFLLFAGTFIIYLYIGDRKIPDLPYFLNFLLMVMSSIPLWLLLPRLAMAGLPAHLAAGLTYMGRRSMDFYMMHGLCLLILSKMRTHDQLKLIPAYIGLIILTSILFKLLVQPLLSRLQAISNSGRAGAWRGNPLRRS